MTIPYNWHKKLNGCNIEVRNRIDEPVKEEYMSELRKIGDFMKSFDEKGMMPCEFEKYGGFRATVAGFISGYDDLLKLIRGYMI